MSQWVGNYANLRDLSVAQGHGVPVRIDGVVADHENPPALNFPEDTEDQFFRHYMGATGDSRASHDLGIIQQMLEMVRVDNPPTQHVSTTVLNPKCAEFLPEHNTNLNDNKQYTDRWGRNVALKSLLEADNQKSRTQKLRLLTPDDIIQNNMAYVREQSQRYLLQPNDVFKQKTPQKDSVPELNNNTYYMDMYEPSESAVEYYNKYMKSAELKTYLKEDIWVKMEKKIKEIEERKEQAAESSEWGFIDDHQNLNLVRLPHHRHVIAEECVVCDMVKKHSFNIVEILSEDKRM